MNKYIKVNQPLVNVEPELIGQTIIALNVLETMCRLAYAKKIPVKIEENEEDYSYVFVRWSSKVQHMAVF